MERVIVCDHYTVPHSLLGRGRELDLRFLHGTYWLLEVDELPPKRIPDQSTVSQCKLSQVEILPGRKDSLTREMTSFPSHGAAIFLRRRVSYYSPSPRKNKHHRRHHHHHQPRSRTRTHAPTTKWTVKRAITTWSPKVNNYRLKYYWHIGWLNTKKKNKPRLRQLAEFENWMISNIEEFISKFFSILDEVERWRWSNFRRREAAALNCITSAFSETTEWWWGCQDRIRTTKRTMRWRQKESREGLKGVGGGWGGKAGQGGVGGGVRKTRDVLTYRHFEENKKGATIMMLDGWKVKWSWNPRRHFPFINSQN